MRQRTRPESAALLLIESVDMAIKVNVGGFHRAVVLSVPGQHRVVVERDANVPFADLGLVKRGREQVANLTIVVVAPNEDKSCGSESGRGTSVRFCNNRCRDRRPGRPDTRGFHWCRPGN